MIYGQDEPMLFPVADLYDSGMMLMYINAAREQYNLNREDMKEFLKTHGDFFSPFSKDMEWVDAQTRGRVNDALNYMQANGIDPLRSAEGRALIQRVIRDTDVAGINARRLSAENRKAYDTMVAKMKAEGTYNEDFANWDFARRHNGVLPNEWNTGQYGIWQDMSPERYQDLNAATAKWYDQLQKGYLYTDAQGYEWWGNTPDDIRSIAQQHMPDLTSSYWQYQRELARRQLGPNATEDDVLRLFEDNIVAAAAEKYTRPERRESEEKKRAETYKYNAQLDNLRTANDIRANRQKEADKYQYEVLRAADLNLDGKVDEDEMSQYRQSVIQSRSAGASGGSSATSLLSAGVADQLSLQQILDYADNKLDFISAYNSSSNNAFKKLKSLYDELSDKDKEVAVQYGKDYRTLVSNTATTAQKEAAQKRLDAYERKKDPKFLAWKDQFMFRMNNYSKTAEQSWIDNNTTEGLAGYDEQSSSDLRTRSRQIFDRNNVVRGFTDQQKTELNKQLGYITNDTGGRDGIMNRDRDVQDIVISEMTGNRRYRYNATPKKVSRIIKGKRYTIDSDEIISREYGAGTIGKKQYNVINENATFTDPDVVKQLDKIGEEELRRYGITKITVDGKEAYKIPITSKYGHGQGRADVNSLTLKRTRGASEASKLEATTQAAEIQANIEGR